MTSVEHSLQLVAAHKALWLQLQLCTLNTPHTWSIDPMAAAKGSSSCCSQGSHGRGRLRRALPEPHICWVCGSRAQAVEDRA